ncbi:MAG: hypothetical protein H0W82_00035 [Actinobacteria bacterium]|nr:hypothetical protein [Actinomycetota bacterium]
MQPDTKVCEECGRAFSRKDIPGRQPESHWRVRRFCSLACSIPARSSAQRGQVRKVDATPQAGRKRARLLYPGPHACDECGDPAEIHHRDGNALNNERENIAFLCRKHHIGIERRMAYRAVEMTPEKIEHRRIQNRDRQRRYRQRKKEGA